MNFPRAFAAISCVFVFVGIDATAIAQEGIVVGWGSNTYGESIAPTDLGQCTQIAAGSYHTAVIQLVGNVKAWGYNSHGQTDVPTGLGACTQIAAGERHTVALQQSGIVRAWGYNVQGQCNIPSDLGVCTQIAGGGAHTIAIQINTSDVDGDGIPAYLDNCPTFANPTQADCDSDGIGDACEIIIVRESGNMGAFGNGVTATGVLTGCTNSLTPIAITVDVSADLNLVTEYATVKLGGVVLSSTLFQVGAHDCPTTPDTAVLEISSKQWNTAVAAFGGNISVSITGSVLVSATQCSSPFANISVRYGDSGGFCDCNHNGISDPTEIANGSVPDCNGNGDPDSCDIVTGFAKDCNANAIPDSCDIASGLSNDVEPNGVPDECKTDCNGNGLPDAYEIAQGLQTDCNANAIPDSCDIASGFALDCNVNAIPDSCDIASGFSKDCNANAIPDSCDIASGLSKDCNSNSIPDSCDIAAGEPDKDADGRPDQCEFDYGDFDLDGTIGGKELAVILSIWGQQNPLFGDLDHNGEIGGGDLTFILSRWGPVSY